MFKKTAVVLGLILLTVIIGICLIPVVFQKQIGERIEEELNSRVNAEVNYGGFSISVFRSFPNLTVSLNNLTVVGAQEFKGDTLVAIKNFDFTVGLLNIIRGKGYQVISLNLQQPIVKLCVDSLGQANWNVIKQLPYFSKDTGISPVSLDTGFLLQVNNWKVENGYIEYRNDTAHSLLVAEDFESGYKQQINGAGSDIYITNSINKLTYSASGINYLQKVKMNADIKLSAENTTGVYQVKENLISLNDLKLLLKGTFKSDKTGQYFDMSIQSRDSAFKNLLSLFPASDTTYATGNFALLGNIKGLNNDVQLPAVSLKLDITNGSLNRPGFAKPVKHIFVETSVMKPEGVLDSTVINVTRLHVETGNDSINAKLLITTPDNNALLEAAVEGGIDLSSISSFYPLPGTKLNGLLLVKLKFKGHKRDMDRKKYKLIEASGYAHVSDAEYEGNGLALPLKISEANFTIHPDFVSLDKLKARAGESDFSATGNFEQVIPYLMNQGRLIAALNVHSDTISINSFIGKAASPIASGKRSGVSSGAARQTTVKTEAATAFQLTVNAQANVVYYEKLVLHKLSGRLEADQAGVTIKGMTANLFGGILFVNTHSTHFKNGLADVSFQLRANNMDMQKVYHSFDEAEKSAPWVQYLNGSFSGGVDGTGKIKSDMNLIYKTINARGRLQMRDMKIDNMPVLTEIGKLAKVKSFDHLEAKNVYSVFAYKNGTTNIDSTDVRFTSGERIQFKGESKPDQTLDADIDLNVPVKEFGHIASLAQNLLSGFMSVPDNVRFVFKVTGKSNQPVVKLVNVGTSDN